MWMRSMEPEGPCLLFAVLYLRSGVPGGKWVAEDLIAEKHVPEDILNCIRKEPC